MFNNLGFHFEVITPLSLVLLIVGGILGYGSKFVLGLIYENPSDKTILIFKFIGLILVITGVIIIFRR